MKDLKDFTTQLVKIEYLDHCNAFGFYPFQMYIENKDEKPIIASLCLGGDIRAVYNLFAEYYNDNAKRIYVAVDFPASGDITNDFVCVIGYEKEEITLYAIPYNTETGDTYSEIRDSETLNKIQDDLGKFMFNIA